MKAYYMHTIDGKPAAFAGEQICFASFHGSANQLCSSLRQIRREQSLTLAYRKASGFSEDSDRYGYLRFAAQGGPAQ